MNTLELAVWVPERDLERVFTGQVCTVKLEAAPKSLEDLLKPEFRGKVAMPDPTRGVIAASWPASLYKLMVMYEAFAAREAGNLSFAEDLADDYV